MRALLALYTSLSRTMAQITQGNLNSQAVGYCRDELGAMGHSLCKMVITLSSMVADIRSNAALSHTRVKRLQVETQRLQSAQNSKLQAASCKLQAWSKLQPASSSCRRRFKKMPKRDKV
ncbi:MAG: hypothetical protein K2Q97_16820 [Burkholderiaceae bacterium]|nr:hypothetical protein [Burkholderiaceae bacterium]